MSCRAATCRTFVGHPETRASAKPSGTRTPACDSPRHLYQSLSTCSRKGKKKKKKLSGLLNLTVKARKKALHEAVTFKVADLCLFTNEGRKVCYIGEQIQHKNEVWKQKSCVLCNSTHPFLITALTLLVSLLPLAEMFLSRWHWELHGGPFLHHQRKDEYCLFSPLGKTRRLGRRACLIVLMKLIFLSESDNYFCNVIFFSFFFHT